MPEEQDSNYDRPPESINSQREREQKRAKDEEMKQRWNKMEQSAKNKERVKRAVLCGVTATVTWKFANGQARRQAAKTAYVLGRQAGEREAQLEVMVLDHVRFLEKFDMLPLFKKVVGYSVEIDTKNKSRQF